MPSFAAGLAAGVLVSGVVLLASVAIRRTLRRRREHVPVLDLEPNSAELDTMPANEANAPEPPRLEGELPEAAPQTQRW